MRKAQKKDFSLSAAWISGCLFVFMGVLFFTYWVGYSINETPTEMNIHLHPVSLIVITMTPIVMLVGGILLLKDITHRTFISLIIILIAGFSILFIPSMYINKVQITSAYIAETTGTYFNPSTNKFQLSDIQSIKIDWHNYGRFIHRLWVITYKDGRTEDFGTSPAWEYNEAEIVQKLQQFGVTIQRN